MSRTIARDFAVMAERYGPGNRWLDRIQRNMDRLDSADSNSRQLAITRSILGDFANLAVLGVFQAECRSKKRCDSKLWPELWRFHHYHCWELRACYEYLVRYERRAGKGLDAHKLARAVIRGVLFNDIEFLDWAGPLVAHFFWADGAFDRLDWSGGPSLPMALRIWALANGWDKAVMAAKQSPRSRTSKNQVHHDVFDNWEDDNAFSKAFQKSVARQHDDGWVWMDFTRLPLEFMTLLKIRKEQGLKAPAIKHPWLKLPVSQLPARWPTQATGTYFDECLARCLQLAPELAQAPKPLPIDELIAAGEAPTATKPAKPVGGVLIEPDQCHTFHLWVGKMNKTRSAKYLTEAWDDEDDDVPISEFAADMKMLFYDHDFLQCRSQRLKADVEPLLEEMLHPEAFLDAAVEKYQRIKSPPVNFAVGVWDASPSKPKSISKPGVELHYLGQFTRMVHGLPAGSRKQAKKRRHK